MGDEGVFFLNVHNKQKTRLFFLYIYTWVFGGAHKSGGLRQEFQHISYIWKKKSEDT